MKAFFRSTAAFHPLAAIWRTTDKVAVVTVAWRSNWSKSGSWSPRTHHLDFRVGTPGCSDGFHLLILDGKIQKRSKPASCRATSWDSSVLTAPLPSTLLHSPSAMRRSHPSGRSSSRTSDPLSLRCFSTETPRSPRLCWPFVSPVLPSPKHQRHWTTVNCTPPWGKCFRKTLLLALTECVFIFFVFRVGRWSVALQIPNWHEDSYEIHPHLCLVIELGGQFITQTRTTLGSGWFLRLTAGFPQRSSPALYKGLPGTLRTSTTAGSWGSPPPTHAGPGWFPWSLGVDPRPSPLSCGSANFHILSLSSKSFLWRKKLTLPEQPWVGPSFTICTGALQWHSRMAVLGVVSCSAFRGVGERVLGLSWRVTLALLPERFADSPTGMALAPHFLDLIASFMAGWCLALARSELSKLDGDLQLGSFQTQERLGSRGRENDEGGEPCTNPRAAKLRAAFANCIRSATCKNSFLNLNWN